MTNNLFYPLKTQKMPPVGPEIARQEYRVAENRVARQRRCYEGSAASTKKELPQFFLEIWNS